jgi:hypothetical protein
MGLWITQAEAGANGFSVSERVQRPAADFLRIGEQIPGKYREGKTHNDIENTKHNEWRTHQELNLEPSDP